MAPPGAHDPVRRNNEMADSKNAPSNNVTRTPEPAAQSGEPQGSAKGVNKSYEEELKDDKFQGTGDSELITVPPQKDTGITDKNRNPPGAEKDTSTDSADRP